MRHTLLVPPLVLLTSACASRPSTPAASLTNAPTPGLASIDFPSRNDALARWQLPPGDPWAAYAKYTLLSALTDAPVRARVWNLDSLVEVRQARDAGIRVAQNGLLPDTLWVVDMRGAASVAFGVGLSQGASESVSLVPTFNNWPAENEIVPAEETLEALATMAPRLPEGDAPTHPVFLLDAWRLAFRDDEPGDDAYDNRYILSPSDLPDTVALRARGVRRIVYVVESMANTRLEEDDLHAAFASYEEAGLGIRMVDLAFLDRPIDDDSWEEAIDACVFHVQPRATLIVEPWFYARAQGGFGGLHARPVPVFGAGRRGGPWGGGGWHGGGG
jgi:hypothetical protein